MVLFNINGVADIEPILKWDPDDMSQALQQSPDRHYTLSLVSNKNALSSEVMLSSLAPGRNDSVNKDLGLSWPVDVYSLTHVALPFPPEDPLYGGQGNSKSPGIHLGDIALRGERDVLHIPPSEMLRLRWNPFSEYIQSRTLQFMQLD